MKKFKKPFVFSLIYSLFLILLSAAVLLDVFVIPKEIAPSGDGGIVSADIKFTFGEIEDVPVEDTTRDDNSISDKPIESTENSDSGIDNYTEYDTTVPAMTDSEIVTTGSPDTEPEITLPVISDTEYRDDNIRITLDTIRLHDTQIYVADIYLSSAEYFKTAIAKNKFGTNINDKTSTIAKENGAILAINGDYYGANKKGYVIKNGILYRESIRSDYEYDDLGVMFDGSFKVFNEKDISAKDLLNSGVYQLFGFGPVLVSEFEICVKPGEEVGVAMASNPRTAIGIIDELHYVFVVSDGRTKESKGLSLMQLAELMKEIGCKTAYNLDGGGSSTMYFNGRVVNKPVNRGSTISERWVSDIVYIGY